MSRTLTQDQFINRALSVHENDIYDFSNSKYVNAKTKVEVFCKKHSELFLITPDALLSGSGCRKCSIERRADKRRMTVDEFIRRGKIAHGDQFDYSKVEYKNAITKVMLYCRKHDFWHLALPQDHINGKGCRKCRGEKISAKKFKTQEEFLERCVAAHGSRYDYSKVVYRGMLEKVTIICHIHGEWDVVAKNHPLGHGCPRCGFDEGSSKNRKSQDEFLRQAIETHGEGKYDYSEVEYINSSTPVTIICHKHNGEVFRFNQSPNNHISGANCPKCVGNYMPTKEEYIEEVRSVFGDLYDLSRIEYNGRYGIVWLKCPEHGWFQKKSRDVLKGQGCPKCAVYGFNKGKPAILYYLKITHNYGVFYKIGITNKTVEERFNVRDLSKIEVLRIWVFEDGAEAYKTEQLILEECKESKAGICDILCSGNTEIFNCDILE